LRARRRRGDEDRCISGAAINAPREQTMTSRSLTGPGFEPKPISDREFSEFILEKWKNSNCPRCELNDWTVPASGDRKIVMPVQAAEGSQLTRPRGGHFLHVFCSNCGHVEFVAQAVVQRWQRTGK
jgi:predicted nucleic-acid-binding Zn-ribbon protein